MREAFDADWARYEAKLDEQDAYDALADDIWAEVEEAVCGKTLHHLTYSLRDDLPDPVSEDGKLIIHSYYMYDVMDIVDEIIDACNDRHHFYDRQHPDYYDFRVGIREDVMEWIEPKLIAESEAAGVIVDPHYYD